MSALILDNFLPYPNVVREWVTKQQFYDAREFTLKYGQHTDWPGKRTDHVSDLDSTYADVVLTQVANIANRTFGITNISIRSYFQLTTVDDGDSWVHQDNDVEVAGILYLNQNPPTNSGTTFYKCKDVSKWESYMSTGQGYNILKTINSIDNTQLYNELFEPLDVVGNVFNRLVMYPGITYHKSNNYFGDSKENGRLTQVFFIKRDQ